MADTLCSPSSPKRIIPSPTKTLSSGHVSETRVRVSFLAFPHFARGKLCCCRRCLFALTRRRRTTAAAAAGPNPRSKSTYKSVSLSGGRTRPIMSAASPPPLSHSPSRRVHSIPSFLRRCVAFLLLLLHCALHLLNLRPRRFLVGEPSPTSPLMCGQQVRIRLFHHEMRT